MRGLQAPVSQVCFSANNRYLVALAQNWQLGVWDLETHRLLHVFETPIGIFAQSAGLAIDAEGRRVAVVAGTEARVWDVATGSEEKSLTLNAGFLDCLAFHGENELLSIRQESIDPQFLPFGPNQYPEKTPRVCRVRNLLGIEPLNPLLEITDFKASAVAIKTNGHGVVIEGYDVAGSEPERIIKYFELPPGTERWSQRSKYVQDSHRVDLLDPTGRFLAMGDETFKQPMLVDFGSGQKVRSLKMTLRGLGPGAKINVAGTNIPDTPNGQKRVLLRGDSDEVLFTLGDLNTTSFEHSPFSSDGRYVAGGNIDGTVTVCDIERVRQKLAELGLGWKGE